ncbi:DciA family protein [Pasteurella sp. PK-2025]|uniref:DciA family protein n=1 Tax=unclassified Pasteurella TaxID=2621516 RepID=UPI003C774DA5
MRYEKPMNVKELLETSHFAKIMQKGCFLNELNLRLQALFPNQYQGCYQVADLESDTLYIQVANATVRQALLFRQHELLKLVQQAYPHIHKLQFSINPELVHHK